ncbi:hypothetical protein KSP39_PZI012605 [Platanthera zijinensis]|uniref:Uncharacterized protein n=1 Tax=Platanthera zijinensis TaxID=2320716 RepID=A0AAP0BGH1_9ASPA
MAKKNTAIKSRLGRRGEQLPSVREPDASDARCGTEFAESSGVAVAAAPREMDPWTMESFLRLASSCEWNENLNPWNEAGTKNEQKEPKLQEEGKLWSCAGVAGEPSRRSCRRGDVQVLKSVSATQICLPRQDIPLILPLCCLRNLPRFKIPDKDKSSSQIIEPLLLLLYKEFFWKNKHRNKSEGVQPVQHTEKEPAYSTAALSNLHSTEKLSLLLFFNLSAPVPGRLHSEILKKKKKKEAAEEDPFILYSIIFFLALFLQNFKTIRCMKDMNCD